MFGVHGSRITLTRGDSALLAIDLYKDNMKYSLQEGDVVRFALKKNIDDNACLIRKELTTDAEGNLILEILPSDTKELPLLTEYKYDIELTTTQGKVHTFLKGELYLDEEVD